MWPGGGLPGCGVPRGPLGGCCHCLGRQGDKVAGRATTRPEVAGQVRLGALHTSAPLCAQPVLMACAHELLLGVGSGASAAPQIHFLPGSALCSASLGSSPGPAGSVAHGLWLPPSHPQASTSHQRHLARGEHHAWSPPLLILCPDPGFWILALHGAVVHVGTVARAGPQGC